MSTPKRPERDDPQTHLLAGKMFLAHMNYLEQSPEDYANIGRALAEKTAFERATELYEQCLDMTDDMLKQILVHDFAGIVLANRLKEWVEHSRVKPQRKVGDEVKFKHDEQPVTGEIIAVDLINARYTVYVESLGHVKGVPGTMGIVVPYETIHPLARPSSDFELEMAM